MDKVRVPAPPITEPPGVGPLLRATPSLYQAYEIGAVPAAFVTNVTFSPGLAVALAGCWVIMGSVTVCVAVA
jgi:hypothetical protein